MWPFGVVSVVETIAAEADGPSFEAIGVDEGLIPRDHHRKTLHKTNVLCEMGPKNGRRERSLYLGWSGDKDRRGSDRLYVVNQCPAVRLAGKLGEHLGDLSVEGKIQKLFELDTVCSRKSYACIAAIRVLEVKVYGPIIGEILLESASGAGRTRWQIFVRVGGGIEPSSSEVSTAANDNRSGASWALTHSGNSE